jgi:hypothetical protein
MADIGSPAPWIWDGVWQEKPPDDWPDFLDTSPLTTHLNASFDPALET